jgi:NitT/TauT family transport system substrate-binding protein
LVPVGAAGDGWTALKTGRIQATWHALPDVYTLVDRGEARILFHLSEYLKDYQQGSLLARRDFLEANGEAARKFIRASIRASEFISSNPAEAARIGASAMGLPEAALVRTIADMPKGFFRVAAPDPKHFAGSIAEVTESGALKTPPAYESVVDTRFLSK